MKKILILSYHFEPMNVIASQRAMGYANHFKKFGFEPTIITFQWDKINEQKYYAPKELDENVIIENKNEYNVYRLPLCKFKRSQILSWFEKTKLNKIGIFISWTFGHLDTTSTLLTHKLTERFFLKKHLKVNNYDIIMGIYSPHFHLSNCKWAHSKYSIPYTMDYRDLWDNRILHTNRKQNLVEKIKNKFTTFWWKKWNKNASNVTITSRIWADKLEEKLKVKANVVYNGFEKDRNDIKNKVIVNRFKIVSTGTIYPDQNLDIILYGIVIFLEKVENIEEISVDFIGLIKENSDIENKLLKIRLLIPSTILNITKRIPKEDSLKLQSEAGVLIFPTTPEIPGTISGKIFEYISSGSPILAAPSDFGGVKEIIVKTNSGLCLDNSNEIAEFLMQKYNEWKISGFCKQDIFEEEVSIFSRENQTKIQANYLKQIVK